MSALIPSNIEILKNQTSIINRNHILLKSRIGKKNIEKKSRNFDKNFTIIRIKRIYKILQYRNKFYSKVA